MDEEFDPTYDRMSSGGIVAIVVTGIVLGLLFGWSIMPANAELQDVEVNGQYVEGEVDNTNAPVTQAQQGTVGRTNAPVLRLPERYANMNRDDFEKTLVQTLFKNAKSAPSRSYNLLGKWFFVEVVPESELNVYYVILTLPTNVKVTISSGQVIADRVLRLVSFNSRGNWLNEVQVGYMTPQGQLLVEQDFANLAYWVNDSLRTNSGRIAVIGERDGQQVDMNYPDVFPGRSPVFPEGQRFIFKGRLYIQQGNSWFTDVGDPVPMTVQEELKIAYQRYLQNIQRATEIQLHGSPLQ